MNFSAKEQQNDILICTEYERDIHGGMWPTQWTAAPVTAHVEEWERGPFRLAGKDGWPGLVRRLVTEENMDEIECDDGACAL